MRARKKKHLTERMESASDYLIYIPEEETQLSFLEIFGNSNPVHLEIGCGKGRFICGKGEAYPDINFIGLEKVSDILVMAMEKAKDANLKNVRFINFDAQFIEKYFGKGNIDTIYLNFSDPWPKSRNEKRRLTYKTFLQMYKVLLKDGCPLIIKTDNRPFFDYSVESLKEFGARIEKISYDLHAEKPADNIETEYEQRFSAMGIPINYCKAYL